MSILSHRTAAAILGASLSITALAADPAISAGQRKLKERGFYTGEATGANDEATRSAVRRFQIREGLEVTGNLDQATAAALQNDAAARPEVSAADDAPAGPSVRERARNVVEDDRAFLNRVEAADIDEPPAEQVAPPVRPEIRESAPPERREPAPPKPKSRVVEQEPPAPERPARVEPRERPEPREPREAREPAPVAAGPSGMSAAEARRFVESYLSAAEGPSPEGEVSFYADEVDYFDSGKVGRSFVAKDQRSYYKRWPKRQFNLVGEPTITRTSATGASLRFRVRYAVDGGDEKGKGEVENFVRLRKTGSGYKIAAIRERKLN
ncbi:MAG TPA: peptidoglycan-binding domain-containing protein [Chthoniobacteraceae bacterium]|jgi:peptidoglycan hydrolase-like protein with peptidoglycan-binding domain